MRTRYNYGGRYSYGGRYKNGGGPLQSLMKRYDNGTGSVTNGDEEKKKKKRLVESAYGSGEDRITAADIKANPGLDPFREYIPGQMGMRDKRVSSPGYFLMEGYTDEQQQKNIERGRPDATQQYIMEINPDGSRRAIPVGQVMDEFTSGAEGEGLADILEAMDIGITRTDEGFTMPSKEDQIRAIMKKRGNYGLGDITFEELQKELGLNVPEMQKGEYRDALERAMSRRASGQVTQARGSR